MTTPTVQGVGYQALQNRKRSLIRKAKQGSIFMAETSADHITEDNFTDPDNYLLLPLPTGYSDLGWGSDDGASFSSDIDTSDVSSWGSVTPTRTDITSESTEMAISFQETNARTIALFSGVDPKAVRATAGGVTPIYKPLSPIRGEYHFLNLAVDQTPKGEIYIARYWPVGQLTDKDDQNYSSGDDPIMWPVTISGRPDDDLGTSEVQLFGGPGWVALLEEMGIPRDAA